MQFNWSRLVAFVFSSMFTAGRVFDCLQSYCYLFDTYICQIKRRRLLFNKIFVNMMTFFILMACKITPPSALGSNYIIREYSKTRELYLDVFQLYTFISHLSFTICTAIFSSL